MTPATPALPTIPTVPTVAPSPVALVVDRLAAAAVPATPATVATDDPEHASRALLTTPGARPDNTMETYLMTNLFTHESAEQINTELWREADTRTADGRTLYEWVGSPLEAAKVDLDQWAVYTGDTATADPATPTTNAHQDEFLADTAAHLAELGYGPQQAAPQPAPTSPAADA